MTDHNYYAVLGVRRTDDLPTIRNAYVRRLRETHPDLERPTTYPKARIEDLQRAYHCLRDADARAAHDADLRAMDLANNIRLQRVQRRLLRKDRSPAPRRRSLRIAMAGKARWRLLLLLAITATAAMEYARVGW